MKETKTTIKEKAAETGVLPEFINGIPTAKHRSRERRSLIAKYYSNLWKKLQKEGRRNTIFNDFLGVNIYIIENESNKKTTNTASMNWQSTYALQHLEEVVQKANRIKQVPFNRDHIRNWLFQTAKLQQTF